MPTKLPEQPDETPEEVESVVYSGILKNPLKWFASIPYRSLLIVLVVLLVPFAGIFSIIIAAFGTYVQVKRADGSIRIRPKVGKNELQQGKSGES